MYGMIAKIVAIAGKREELITLLTDGARDMPGCLSYVIANDAADENTIWVTEAWDSEAAHDTSLTLPQVKNAITQAKPIIANFTKIATTAPVADMGRGLRYDR